MPISNGKRLGEEVGEVGRRCGRAAHLGVDAARRDDVVAQCVHELVVVSVLRRALRVQDDEGDVVVDRRRERRCDVRGLIDRLDELAERGLIGGCLALDRDQHRPVVTGAEALGEQVVGPPHRLALRLVPEVTEPEADGEQRQGEQDQQAGGADHARPRTALDDATPAVPEAPFLGLLGAVRHQLAQRLDGEARRRRRRSPARVRRGRARPAPAKKPTRAEDDGDP